MEKLVITPTDQYYFVIRRRWPIGEDEAFVPFDEPQDDGAIGIFFGMRVVYAS